MGSYQTITNASSVDALSGVSDAVGGSIATSVLGFPFMLGYDKSNFSFNGQCYNGNTLVTGVGTTGAELHYVHNNTSTLSQFNIFDLLN